MDSSFGPGYLSAESILTTAITPIILIVVGYSMELVPELIGPCIKTIFLRIILQAAMIMGVLIAVKYLVGSSRLLNLAIIIYMSSPATFSMQTFLKKKESSAYAPLPPDFRNHPAQISDSSTSGSECRLHPVVHA